jgi:chorismate-pyruvate lyase
MPTSPDLSLFQQVLLATDGTVTDLVALYAGEPIRVHKLEQSVRQESSDTLECPAPTGLLYRSILLCGAARNFLHAESVFVLDRLAQSMRQHMLETDRPIGLLWKEERLESFREILDQSIEPCARIAQYFGVAATTPFVSRTYVVHHNRRPLGMITERWPISQFR